MASLTSLPFLLILFSTTAFTLAAATAGNTFRVDFHHRFSDKVRRWAESQGLPATWHPEKTPKGSAEYYKELVRHDRALLSRRGRSLAATDDVYSFVPGNDTMRISSLGYLHYALVTVGTPNQTFLVALSTGSELFWLPCNCKQCAPDTSPLYGNLTLSTYNTNESSTSKEILCGSSQCNLPTNLGGTCTGTSNNCPYSIMYSSNNTSSSGFLVEDVLYLAKGDTGVDTVTIPIVFGCGEVQTGTFLDEAAPNGLMGLGIDNMSIPTILAKKGLISDSFSMCFGSDGSGRLNFGDTGSSNQSVTALNINNNSPNYNISIEGMVIGNTTTETSFTARVSSGASCSYMSDQIYKEFTTTFTEQVKETRLSDPSLPFEYCYTLSAGDTEAVLPEVSFTTKGGSNFPVLDPIVYLSSKTSQEPTGYCLAVVPGNDTNVIGQNFLTGLRVVFNREKMVLGWEKYDCYGTELSTAPPTDKNASPPPPTDKNASPPPPAVEAPAPGTTLFKRTKSWAPKFCPSTMLNIVLSLLFMVFVIDGYWC
ncbi:aspartyl protease family protein 1-like isoform X2 [Carex rostrata]